MPQKLLLFDFNGVISYHNFWQDIYIPGHPLYEMRTRINDYIFKDNFDTVKKWMVGESTAEAIHEIIEQGLGISSEILFPLFVKGSEEIDISPEITTKIIELRKAGYRTALVTDNMDSFPRFTRPANPVLDEAFEAIYDSYTTKRLKKQNEGEVFKKISSDFGIALQDTYYFDDSKANCDFFMNLGGKAICVTGIPEVLAQIELAPKA